MTETDLLKKVKRLDAIRVQERKLEVEKRALMDEIQATIPLGATEIANGWGVKVYGVLNWQSFDGKKVADAYHIEDFPEIYLPNYKLTKDFLNKLYEMPATSSDLIKGYCQETIRVDVIKPKGKKRSATPTRDLVI